MNSWAAFIPEIDLPLDMDSEVVDEATGTEVQTELTMKDISNMQELNVLYEYSVLYSEYYIV